MKRLIHLISGFKVKAYWIYPRRKETMMESISGQLNLGAFNITMPERWDAQFFPSIETKLRLVKKRLLKV
jgi:hypothetical protein